MFSAVKALHICIECAPGLLPSWHSPVWNQSSLHPLQRAASPSARLCSGPDERGSWIWRASRAHQGLPAGRVHPSKQQFPKKGRDKKETMSLRAGGVKEWSRVISQTGGKRYERRKPWTKRVHATLHIVVRHSTSAKGTSHDRGYKCII